MLRLLIILIVVCNILAVSAVAEDGNELQQLLSKMNQTLERGNYEGTFVFMHKGNVETMSIVHGYSDKGVREKLVSLTGDAREVIRDQDVLTCIWPRDKLVVIESASATHGLPSSLPTDLNELAFHYKLTEVGQARIAGHDCTLVRIQPLDELRYGHEICVENLQGMVLGSKTFDTSGLAIENMMFTSFRMRETAPEKLFQPSVHLNDYTWKTASVELNGELQPDQAWKIEELPPGFSLQSVTRKLMSASNNPVQHMVLTDGLASVSVFISKVDNPEKIYKGAHKQGVINAYARDLNQHQITVVGEVPQGTVKMIGSSVTYTPLN
ncbi:MAG: MucB/RseB C-terminal domain-containing protein [Gammaproteobacteria bacterium]